jgi:hypothetical protein
MLTINLLQALPKTPLWDRLAREDRLIDDETRDSNVAFRLPYAQVLAIWRDCMARAYAPETLFDRYRHQVAATYPNRLQPAYGRERTSWRNIRRGLVMLARIVWHAGLRSDYRAEFWRFVWPLMLRGELAHVIRVGLMAHHMIISAREASAGRQTASHYSTKVADVPVAAE